MENPVAQWKLMASRTNVKFYVRLVRSARFRQAPNSSVLRCLRFYLRQGSMHCPIVIKHYGEDCDLVVTKWHVPQHVGIMNAC